MSKTVILVGGTSVVCLAAGAAAGYFYAEKTLETRYEQLARQEIEEAKRYYATLYKKDNFSTPQQAVKELLPVERQAVEAMRNYNPEFAEGPDGELVVERAKPFEGSYEIEDDAEVVVRNVFTEAQPESPVVQDYQTLIRNRTEEAPYVISKDEFHESDEGFRQITLTYYDGDNTLSDERDDIIHDTDETIGDDNLTRFGVMSEDANVVYVRNHVLGVDFEVIRSMGEYKVEVAGFVPEPG